MSDEQDIPLTGRQQAFYDQIVAQAAEVMQGYRFVDDWHSITPETLRAAGAVVAECLRKSGVPVVRVQAEVNAAGELNCLIALVEPRGYG